MKTTDAVSKAGSAAALAKLLEISPSAVSQWGEDVPQSRVWQLQVLCPSWFTASQPIPKKQAPKGHKEAAHG